MSSTCLINVKMIQPNAFTSKTFLLLLNFHLINAGKTVNSQKDQLVFPARGGGGKGVEWGESSMTS